MPISWVSVAATQRHEGSAIGTAKPKARTPLSPHGPSRALSVMLSVGVLAAAWFGSATVANWFPDSWSIVLRNLTASVAAAAVRAVRIPVVLANGNELHLSHHVLRIDLACTALQWMILFTGFVVAIPVASRRKYQALIVGAALIVTANAVRLVAVAGTSEWAPQWFGFVHIRVMQSAMALLVAAIWGVWLWTSRDDWRPEWQ